MKKTSIKKLFNNSLIILLFYSIVWIVLAVIGQFCELWDVEYWVGIYVFLLPILISGCSLLSMLGTGKKLRIIKFILLPIFYGASYIGLQYATYGIRSLTPKYDFYANWIEPWTGICATLWSLAFVFVGWIIQKCTEHYEKNSA